MNIPTLQETLEVVAGELQSAMCPKEKWNNNLPKIIAKTHMVLEAVVSPLQKATTGHLGSRSAATRKCFPTTVKKSRYNASRMRLEGPLRVVVVKDGFLVKTALEHLAWLTGTDSTGDVGSQCPAKRQSVVPVTL